MERALRACAIVIGSVSSLCVAISLTWWSHPAFGYRVGDAVLFISFMTGFLGFFAMFVLGIIRLEGRGGPPALFHRGAVPVLLIVWLALVLAAAGVSAAVASDRQGKWSADTAYGWHHCHWPLTANHDSEHLCVSHARWQEVSLETAHIFVGFGALFSAISCLAFTALARLPRPSVQLPPPWTGVPGNG